MTNPVLGQSNNYFDSAYSETPPWDTGKPQPDLIALLDEFPPTSPMLEVGCGTGDLSIALAQRGLNVLGVDATESAINQARAKVTGDPSICGLVEFRVGNALHPENLSGPFAAVIDSGFFHLFDRLERDQFAEALATSLADGGRYYLLGFAFDSPVPNSPRQVRDSELRELFASERGWADTGSASRQIHRAYGTAGRARYRRVHRTGESRVIPAWLNAAIPSEAGNLIAIQRDPSLRSG